MVEHIQQLILSNNCVVIPGFGAFIGNYQPAEISLAEQKILPPSKNVVFNKSLQTNDGLLINFIAKQFSISYHEAEIKVILFSKYCNDTLLQHKTLIFNNIGRFTLTEEQNIQFNAFNQINYLPESIGLTTLSLTPIQRLKDTEIQIKENYQRILHPELMTDASNPKKKKYTKHNWIFTVLFVAITTTFIGYNVQKNYSTLNYASLFPMLDNSKPKVYILPKIVDTTNVSSKFIQHKIADANNQIVKSNINVDAVIENNIMVSKNKSYIVIGTFFDKTRAEKLKQESIKIGFSTLISTQNNDKLFRVIISTENKDVTTTLDNIKATLNPRAWVFCVKCNLN